MTQSQGKSRTKRATAGEKESGGNVQQRAGHLVPGRHRRDVGRKGGLVGDHAGELAGEVGTRGGHHGLPLNELALGVVRRSRFGHQPAGSGVLGDRGHPRAARGGVFQDRARRLEPRGQGIGHIVGGDRLHGGEGVKRRQAGIDAHAHDTLPRPLTAIP